jgi:dienelactone hydrolase
MSRRFARLSLIITLCAVFLGGCAPDRRVMIETGYAPPRPAGLSGELILPKTPGPHPAVIVVHGCGGVQAHTHAWAGNLADWGYAALILDSFKTRHIASTCLDPDLLTGRMRAQDVGAAARWLRGRADIDADRVGMIGFSAGGWTAVWTAHPGWETMAAAKPLRAVIGVYPWCDSFTNVNAPFLVLIGEADDWTPAERCRSLQLALGPRDDVAFVYYPNAYHAFDVPGLNATVQGTSGGVTKSRVLLGDWRAHRDAEARVKAWLDRYVMPRKL